MPITFDAPSQDGIIGASSLTISHTVGSGADRVLLVMASCVNGTDYLASATVTYNGTSLGSPIVTPAAGSSNNFAYAWLMVAPPSGTANVVITPSAGAYIDAKIVSAAGVAQASTVDATAKFVNSFAGSPRSLSIASTSGGAVVDFVCVRTPSFTATLDASQTDLGGAFTESGGSSTSFASYKADPVTAMAWTWTGTVGAAHLAVALKSAGGGGPSIAVKAFRIIHG